jgi:hypothetical protein
MEAFARFGWQGIEVTVPVSWELGAHHGDHRAGYVCLDDGREMRLQVRWTPSKGVATDLEGVLRRYQRSMTKACKGNLRFDRQIAEFAPECDPEERTVAPFFWQSGREAFGFASHCRGCGRIVIVEVLFPANESDPSLAGRITGSLVDHRDDGRTFWSIYGFAFSIPSTYNLDHADLAPGRLRFLFRSARRSWLRVERWALASQWMDKVALEVWPEELLGLMRVSRRGPLDKTETQVQGHRAVRFSTTIAGRGFLRRDHVAGLAWRDSEVDKAFVVMEAGGPDGLTLEVADTVRCY